MSDKIKVEELKSIVFRPLRFNKKTGKIIVASYMGWRKVKTADYNKFNLIVSDEYKAMPQDAFVYDHKGEQLFFFNYNPNDIPVYHQTGILDIDLQKMPFPWVVKWIDSDNMFYNCKGVDSDGVPTFSHYDASQCGGFSDIDQFEPLTVATVTKWLGWFLYQLNNSYLQIGK